MLAQVAQRICGVIFWDIQSLSGQGPGLIELPLSRRLEYMTSRGLFQTRLLCDTMIILKSGYFFSLPVTLLALQALLESKLYGF